MHSSLLVASVFSVVLAIHFTFSHANPHDDTSAVSAVGKVALWSVNKLILPYVNIIIATFFSWFIRLITVGTFGISTMKSVVGSEGYMFYGYNFLKNYIGFDPLWKLFTGRIPFE